jgi:hypothetical protein
MTFYERGVGPWDFYYLMIAGFRSLDLFERIVNERVVYLFYSA